jgi:hypothetical protein
MPDMTAAGRGFVHAGTRILSRGSAAFSPAGSGGLDGRLGSRGRTTRPAPSAQMGWRSGDATLSTMADTRRGRGGDTGADEAQATATSRNNDAPGTADAGGTAGAEVPAPETPPEGTPGGPDPVRAIESVVEAAAGAAEGIAGAIVGGISAVAERISKAMSPEPLANLYEVHPEARLASPRELGFRFVPVEDIRGTAVAGIAQRGLDFLPLPPFRGENWQARWQRIRDANARLKPLPPVDLVKYEGGYWVVDGHNRVGAALADNAAGLDAMVTELVPLDGRSSERPTELLSLLGEIAELRAAASGRRPAVGVRLAEPPAAGEMEGLVMHAPDGSDADPNVAEQAPGEGPGEPAGGEAGA